MRKITESGATIIFVSHDMFAVQRLCDRVVWLDKGRIVKEGESLEVIKAYQAFIREKDELRLRARAMKLKNQELTSMDLKDEECILCHFVTAGDTHPDSKHPIHSIKLYCGDHRIDELLIGDAADNDPKRKFCIVTTPGYTDWGKPYKLDGRFVRNFEYTKSMYKHAPFYIYGLFHPENDYIFEFCELLSTDQFLKPLRPFQ